MARKPTNWIMYGKMLVVFLACSIGGPAVVYAVSPTEEELFKRYNPDLQKKSLANRQEKQQAFDDYLIMLKKYSKSDKNIWIAAAEAEAERKAKVANTENPST
ncbi:hypothetical protein OIDMADRAFT_156460 [Oidiodendron maius Zn]|uniref:Cytochrome b mRNA-processing protein 4 n=1 Tax=Oidiodendron maius (strain Zn) TaxID=913774 RepID=A0A0C3HQ88_OIDMZ|nr:hypothetical protein OIDMADRAFT_156460 [Oidiodendron maius Zn]